MIPFILTIVGGYLIGDSMKEDKTFSDGGSVDGDMKIKDVPRLDIYESSFFPVVASIYYPAPNENISRELGGVEQDFDEIKKRYKKNSFTAYITIDKVGREKIGTFKTKEEAKEALLNYNVDKNIVDEVISTTIKLADGGEIESAARRKADNPNWTNEKLLAEYNSLKIDLEDLKDGKITPRKVIGGGYKSSAVAKRVAKEWLENRIAEYKMSLEIRGVMADGGMMAKGGGVSIGKPLTEDNIDGAIIMSIENPEWGTWKVLNKYDDRVWEIRSSKGNTTTLFLSEFKFWKRINYADGGMMADGGPIDKAEIDIYKRKMSSYTGRSTIKVYYTKGDIGFDGRLKEYHTGIGWEMEFEPDYFDDKESEDYYDEHSDAIEEEILAYFYSNEWENKKMADGGDIAESNNRMLRSKVKEVKHHADELGRVVKPSTEIEGWVVAKAERSASDLSDITHYLDGQEFADGGQVDEASISNIHRNIMGTISFNMRLKGMRKDQDFIVYPITAEDAGNPIKVQSDTRIGYIDLPTGRGLMSQSHSGGAYNHHLQMDEKIRFTLSNSDAELLKDSIKGTAGSSVGTRGVTTDNAGAAKLADGGKTSQKFLLSVMKNEKIGGKDMLVSGQPVSVTGTMKDAEAKANEIIKDSSVGEVSISKYNEKGRLGKKLKTITQ